MTSMDLFLTDPVLTFERTKQSSTQLDENTENWPRQILTELFRQLPTITEYSPRVMMMKLDEARGTGFGSVIVSSTPDTALSAVRAAGQLQAIIPIVVKDYELQPLDILLKSNGLMTPLTETRLREALFRPQTFELLTNDFGDGSLYNMFYPPGRSANDFGSGFGQRSGGGSAGGVQTLFGPGMKTAGLEMLESLLPTVLLPDVERLAKEIDNDPALLKQAGNNLIFLQAMRVLSEAEGTKTAADLFDAVHDVFDTHVAQVGYSPTQDVYWVKKASRDAFAHRPAVLMDRGAFLKFAGDEVVHLVDTKGTLTVSEAKAPHHTLDTTPWSVVTETGIYRVKDTDGEKEYTGWVIPELLDPDGVSVPMAVFTNGSAGCVQDQIVGHRVATGVDLPSVPPKGVGIFYVSSGGRLIATVPLEVVGGEASMSGGDAYIVRTLTGEECRVRLVEGLKSVTTQGDYFLPSSAKFLPLEDEKLVSLVSDTETLEASKVAGLLESGLIDVIGDGSHYQFRFHGLPKLASAMPSKMDHDQAVFALCLAGVPADTAIEKLAESNSRIVSFQGADVRLMADRVGEAKLAGAERSQQVTALRQYLTKEASVLPDISTVDAVLSLGFINSENISLFVSRIPYLEKALSMICELILASRLGMTEVPDTAASRAAKGLDTTIYGLKSLMLRQTEAET